MRAGARQTVPPVSSSALQGAGRTPVISALRSGHRGSLGLVPSQPSLNRQVPSQGKKREKERWMASKKCCRSSGPTCTDVNTGSSVHPRKPIVHPNPGSLLTALGSLMTFRNCVVGLYAWMEPIHTDSGWLVWISGMPQTRSK